MLKKLAHLYFAIFCLGCFSCKSQSKPSTEISVENDKSAKTISQPVSDFDLTHASKKWKLPMELAEISGISFIDENHVLAIEDLRPVLYLLNIAGDSAIIEKQVIFKADADGKKVDIEDIALIGNTAYALWSHGSVYKIENWQGAADVKKIKTFLSKENNTEGLCYDPVTQNLLMACKNQSGDEDEKKSVKAIYQYDVKADSLKPNPFLLIHRKDFKELAGEKINFFPSAIAVQPQTNNLFILSTKDTKCMAVYSRDGILKSFSYLQKELLPQPEGLCFSPQGNLYISTEGKAGQPGYILLFKKNAQ